MGFLEFCRKCDQRDVIATAPAMEANIREQWSKTLVHLGFHVLLVSFHDMLFMEPVRRGWRSDDEEECRCDQK